MDNIRYEEAITSDIDDLSRLLTDLFKIEKDFNPDIEKQKSGLALLINKSGAATVQVAKNTKGKIIGMVTAQLVISTAQGASSAWIEDMVVDAAYHGHGIGKQLLQQALDWARNNGATRAQLLVDIENTAALGYYEHLKWQSTQLQARRIFL
jgi:GNAT superfamily N-acetyltransferase